MLLELEQVSERSETPKYLIIQDTLKKNSTGLSKGCPRPSRKRGRAALKQPGKLTRWPGFILTTMETLYYPFYRDK